MMHGMDAMLVVVRRGLGYGVAVSAFVGGVLGVVLAFGVLLSAYGGAEETVVGAVVVALGTPVAGAALGVLPGLAVGLLLARPGGVASQRAALGGGGVFLAENLALGLGAGWAVGFGLAFLGTPVAALLAAVFGKAIRCGKGPRPGSAQRA